MAGHLLDTSVIIDALRGRRERVALLERLLSEGHTLACCAVNVAEVYAGMHRAEAAATDAFLQSLDYYDLTWDVARAAGRLKYRHARQGRTLSLSDTLIAAVALINGLTLITDNIKDYPFAGLELFPLG